MSWWSADTVSPVLPPDKGVTDAAVTGSWGWSRLGSSIPRLRLRLG